MMNTMETVGEIAAKDFRKAEVFKKYGIDFCCGGKKTLQQVCDEKGLDHIIIKTELDKPKETEKPIENYERWGIAFLADYIYNKHHQYYYCEEPVITDLLIKVINQHSEQFPQLKKLYSFYAKLTLELNTHFSKEENILFPFIKGLMHTNQSGKIEEMESQFPIAQAIQMMESDHQAAGEILAEINTLTNNYNAPPQACNSFQFLYKKLKALDEDLHQHIHLENNILFPKALAIQKEMNGPATEEVCNFIPHINHIRNISF